MTSKSLEVKNLSKSFVTNGEARSVLENISLAISEGEIATLLGPSGCGKTTLLRIVAGLETASGGKVFFPKALDESSRPKVFLISQEQSLFPWMTIFENVLFGLRGSGRVTTERREIANEALSTTELSHVKDFFPKQISGGMKQRVALARALAMKPNLLLLDEPLSALDSFNREILQEKLVEWVRDAGISVLLVTHSVEEAVFLSDRIFFLKSSPGRVVREMQGLPFNSEQALLDRRKRSDYFEMVNRVKDFFRA